MTALCALVLGLPARPGSVAEVRRAAREHFGGDCSDVQLCVSELLTNVITHIGEGTPVTVRLGSTAEGGVRVEVTDPGRHSWLVPRRPSGDDEGGRGLLLVDALAVRWGVDQGPEGKTVWCELPGGG
ncbi:MULTISPECIES: ATP-binding protein [unclassified Streptomyces]|uniref:ATP-binding protein n=1 Tax=unclassified Streptomyces TaxID=2593676 RepID=UPI00223755D0|nr:ATP-binding protein [Streptomyces sp. SHP 1-2]MCW5251584.1 ATP-binding protein [Streptomyces sp. SHP 1-2]